MLKALLLIPLFSACCYSCADGVIFETPPFRNLSCALNSSTRSLVTQRAIEFASENNFRHSSNEFMTLLTTARLNFVLTHIPDATTFYVIGIARKSPVRAEVALFDRFVGSLPAKCLPAQG